MQKATTIAVALPLSLLLNCGGSSDGVGGAHGGTSGSSGHGGKLSTGGDSTGGVGAGVGGTSKGGAAGSGGGSAGSAGKGSSGGTSGAATGGFADDGGAAGDSSGAGAAGEMIARGGSAGNSTGGIGGVDCGCLRGAYRAVCGIDGKTYDATCDLSCVPVPIACMGQCPCPAACVQETGSCAAGETCCAGLTCCAGVPVPQGQEYCGTVCPKSDVNMKRGFASVDETQILERLAALPISTWSYKTEEPETLHVGPMAQEFKAAFGLGASDRTILQVDADGVAFAAIQALYQRLQELEAKNRKLEERLESIAVERENLRSCRTSEQ